MDKPIILWADLTVNGSSHELRKQFERFCTIRIASPQIADTPSWTGGAPNFACLEYDYPDKRGLAVLRRIKREHPSVPLIMTTLDHSEELAVWAFRAGAWDYLAKPLADADVERVCSRMQCLVEARKPNSRRRPAIAESELPPEARYVAKGTLAQSIFPAMTYIESHFAEKITEKQVAGICGMTTFRFSRAFRENYHTTFREWLWRYRVEQSRRFLENPELTITQVAFLAGFNDASHFGKMFRRHYHRTASEYRAQIADRTQIQSDASGSPLDEEVMQESRLALHAPQPVARDVGGEQPYVDPGYLDS